MDIDIDKAIATGIKTGKVSIGAQSTIQSVKTGRTQMAIVASNSPRKIQEDIAYYCQLSDVPLVIYEGSSRILASVCDKPFLVSALSINDPGDSEILKLVEEEEPQEQYGGTE